MGEETKTENQQDESAATILSAEEKAENSQSFSKPPPSSLSISLFSFFIMQIKIP